MSDLLKAALYYASIGWKIFPCVPREKRPLTTHGVKDATNDPDVIRVWWEKWPDANIGLACGVGSGIYVIDIDIDKEREIDGYASMKDLGLLPGTVTQNTPSGGAHVLFKTDNPPANKNGFLSGIDIRGEGYYIVVAPSIHPSGGQYEWLEGSGPGEVELAEFPDFIRPANPEAPPPASPGHVSQQGSPNQAQAVGTNTLKRASMYLATMAPAIEGQAGGGKLFAAATAMVHGFKLSDAQASALLLAEYNPRCTPPWDMGVTKDGRDFLRKISQVREKPPRKPYGYLADDASWSPENADTSMIDVDSLIAEAALVKVKKEVKQAGDIADLVKEEAPHADYAMLTNPPGLLGDICDWINDTALCRQPMLALACSLTFLGALFGRKVREKLGGRTNVYCMAIADSSAGKQHPMSKISDLCHSAGVSELIGGSDIASDSGIEELVSKSPATLVMVDEIGFLLSAIGAKKDSYSARIVAILMKLYSSAGNVYYGRAYADIENRRTIIQPCLSLYGTSSPARFIEGVAPEEISDGWLGRCLMFRASVNVRKSRSNKLRPGDRANESIVERVQQWYARRPAAPEGADLGQFMVYHTATGEASQVPPEQILVPTTKEADKIFVALDDKADAVAKRDSRLGYLWRKAEENARKISLIVACGESFDDPEITAANAGYACKLMEYLLNDFRDYILPNIVSSQLEARKLKIIEMIDSGAGEGLRHRIIVKRTGYYNQRQREDVLSDLQESGSIIKVSVGKTFYYFTPRYYAEYKKTQDD